MTLVHAAKFYADNKAAWGPGRRTVMLAFTNGAMLSDLDIVTTYNMKRKTVSARRVELWRLGYVVPVGMKKMGRQRVQVWAATLTGNEAIANILKEAQHENVIGEP